MKTRKERQEELDRINKEVNERFSPKTKCPYCESTHWCGDSLSEHMYSCRIIRNDIELRIKQQQQEKAEAMENQKTQENLEIVDRALRLADLENIAFTSAVERIKNVLHPPAPKKCTISVTHSTISAGGIYGVPIKGEREIKCILDKGHDGDWHKDNMGMKWKVNVG